VQVVSRRLFPIQLLVCAAPAYLEDHPTPTRIDDLSNHRCIGYRQPGTGHPMPWEFQMQSETVSKVMPYAVCCSDPEAEMQAVLAGMGIGQIDSINATPLLVSGELVPLLVRYTSARMGLYLYYAQRADMPSRVRRFIDFTVKRLRSNQTFSVAVPELHAMAKRQRAGS
jgi:DNA-binding transcriptional LysR family regulator